MEYKHETERLDFQSKEEMLHRPSSQFFNYLRELEQL